MGGTQLAFRPTSGVRSSQEACCRLGSPPTAQQRSIRVASWPAESSVGSSGPAGELPTTTVAAAESIAAAAEQIAVIAAAEQFATVAAAGVAAAVAATEVAAAVTAAEQIAAAIAVEESAAVKAVTASATEDQATTAFELAFGLTDAK